MNNNNTASVFTQIRGFYRRENGNIAISYDDIAELQNFISFFVSSKVIKTKDEFDYVAKLVLNTVEDTIKTNASKFN